MVIIVMGASRSDRNCLARMIAITLDWEFADALRLPSTSTSHGDESGVTRDETTRAAQIQALHAAVQYWSYKWQDMVVSSWVLTEQERKLISNTSPDAKFVLMSAAECNIQPGASQPPNASPSISPWTTAAQHSNKLLLVDASHRTKEIVADVISALVLNRKLPNVVTC
jgi:gluconokinase